MQIARSPEGPVDGGWGFGVPGKDYDSFMGRYPGALDAVRRCRRGERGSDGAGCRVRTGCVDGGARQRLGVRSVMACDPSAPFVQDCSARYPGVDVRRGTAEDIPFGDGTLTSYSRNWCCISWASRNGRWRSSGGCCGRRGGRRSVCGTRPGECRCCGPSGVPRCGRPDRPRRVAPPALRDCGRGQRPVRGSRVAGAAGVLARRSARRTTTSRICGPVSSRASDPPVPTASACPSRTAQRCAPSCSTRWARRPAASPWTRWPGARRGRAGLSRPARAQVHAVCVLGQGCSTGRERKPRTWSRTVPRARAPREGRPRGRRTLGPQRSSRHQRRASGRTAPPALSRPGRDEPVTAQE